MLLIKNNKMLIKSLIAISVFINFMAIVLIFTSFKLETKRQHSQSFVPRNVEVTNTLINLIENKGVTITRAELISAINISSDSKKVIMGDNGDRSIDENSYDTLHFNVVKDTEVIDKIWIESPKELSAD